jgi:hypothetical protein
VLKRTFAGSCLYLALATLIVISQVAALSHDPFHNEDSVSKCTDGSRHFCPEFAEKHGDRCILCQSGIGGVTVVPTPASESFLVEESIPLIEQVGPRSVLKFLPVSPRAPPRLPS